MQKTAISLESGHIPVFVRYDSISLFVTANDRSKPSATHLNGDDGLFADRPDPLEKSVQTK